MLEYYKWRLKRLKNSLPRLTSHYFWKDIFYYNPKEFIFKLRYGIAKWETWNPDTGIAHHILKTLWFMRDPQGYPVSLIKEEPYCEISAEVSDDYGKQWNSIIKTIRFSFFYYLFISDNLLRYEMDSAKEKEYCRTFAKKKYWYVRDFLTKEFFDEMYPDYIFDYDLKMGSKPCEDKKGYSELTIATIRKDTGEEIKDETIKGSLSPERAVAEKYKATYEKGFDYFKKYFRNLWD